MRRHLPASVGLLALALALPARADQISDMITEFCAPGTPEERQREIAERLKKSGASRLRLPLKKQAPDLDGRSLARLLVAVEHPDAWALLEPKLGGLDDVAILGELVKAEEPRVELIALWKETPASSPRFAPLRDGFAARPALVSENIQRFAEALSISSHADAAAKLVAPWLGLQERAPTEEVRTEWARVARVWKLHAAYAWRYDGGGFLQGAELSGPTPRRGLNQYFAPRSAARRDADPALAGRDHACSVRFLPDRDGFSIAFGARGTSERPARLTEVTYRAGKLTLSLTRGDEVSRDVAPAAWHDLRFAVQVVDASAGTRRLWVFVNDQPLRPEPIACDGPTTRLEVRGEGGALVVADAALYPCKPPATDRDGRLRR